MTKTWVVVAHRAGARLFEHRTGQAHAGKLAHLRDLENPDGRKKSGEIDTDRTVSSTAHEQVAVSFARSLAHELEAARINHQLDQLVLVAEPHFLGLLEAALDRPTARIVTAVVRKDLAQVPGHEVVTHLAHALPL